MTCVPGGPGFTARHGRDRPRAVRAGGERPDRADHGAGRGSGAPAHAGQIRAVATAVAGGRAKSRRLAAALADRPASAGGRQVPGAAGRRRPACRVAPGRRAVGLAAMLRAMRQAAADLPAPRPGLVLRSLRAARRTVRRVREGQAGLLPGPGRAATMREVPGRRRPRSGHRDLRHHHRAGPCMPARTLSPPPSAARLPGPHTSRNWPGRWRNAPRC